MIDQIDYLKSFFKLAFWLGPFCPEGKVPNGFDRKELKIPHRKNLRLVYSPKVPFRVFSLSPKVSTCALLMSVCSL